MFNRMPEIKKLDFKNKWEADTVFETTYAIYMQDGKYRSCYEFDAGALHDDIGIFETIELAQESCQKDFDDRVKLCFTDNGKSNFWG